MQFKNLQGTVDYLPSKYAQNSFSSDELRMVESQFQTMCKRYGYDEVITPTIESSELFKRNIGFLTDIVQKEMYELKDLGDRSIALRPEGTASVIRSYVQSKLFAQPDEVVKLFYKGSMFRQERPQAGRQKEFTQLGCEAIGVGSSALDAEIISLALEFVLSLGISTVELQINSIGCKSCRESYKSALQEKLLEMKECLCEDCLIRMEKNPMRTLDCKKEGCKMKNDSLPLICDYRCEDCQSEFDSLKEYLSTLSVPFVENPKLVRGLDYYEKTAFEFIETSIGAQSAVGGGGRYNKLVSEMGGPEKSGIGFAFGLERLLIVLENSGLINREKPICDYFLIWTNEETKKKQMQIASVLRKQGYRVEMDFSEKKMKSQLKVANRINATFALILAESELERNCIGVKNLQTGEQVEFTINEILNPKE